MVAFDEAALTTLLTEQRYDEVAPQLDEDELKVCISESRTSEYRGAALQSCRMSVARLT